MGVNGRLGGASPLFFNILPLSFEGVDILRKRKFWGESKRGGASLTYIIPPPLPREGDKGGRLPK